jgi:hypothetical protein
MSLRLAVEAGLALVVDDDPHPSNGYKLASDWAQNYDSRYGHGFNAPQPWKAAGAGGMDRGK